MPQQLPNKPNGHSYLNIYIQQDNAPISLLASCQRTNSPSLDSRFVPRACCGWIMKSHSFYRHATPSNSPWSGKCPLPPARHHEADDGDVMMIMSPPPEHIPHLLFLAFQNLYFSVKFASSHATIKRWFYQCSRVRGKHRGKFRGAIKRGRGKRLKVMIVERTDMMMCKHY